MNLPAWFLLFEIHSYSNILLGRIYTAFCEGNATEDLNYLRDSTLRHLKGIGVPLADTILRGDVELPVPCDYLEMPSDKPNKINVNTKMNEFLVDSAIEFNQLNPNDKGLVYDFDHQFIPANKYDAVNTDQLALFKNRTQVPMIFLYAQKVAFLSLYEFELNLYTKKKPSQMERLKF
jgi:hypothetical protein